MITLTSEIEATIYLSLEEEGQQTLQKCNGHNDHDHKKNFKWDV